MNLQTGETVIDSKKNDNEQSQSRIDSKKSIEKRNKFRENHSKFSSFEIKDQTKHLNLDI